MGIGKFIIDRVGMKNSYQGFFEKLIRLGAMGLGYEQPMKSTRLEEKFVVDILSSLSTDIEVTIFDVGANKGDYIHMLLDNMDAKSLTGSIHAFEPAEENFDLLKNRYSNRNVHVNGTGLGLKGQKLTFYKHEQDDISSFHAGKNSSYRSTEIKEEVVLELLSLDEYCEKMKVSFIDLLKIDTEGHEYFVLKGAEEMLKNEKIGAIQFEFSDMNISSKTSFFDFWDLLSPSYNLYRLCKDANFLIKEYDSLIHEIYYPVNFVALKRTR